MPPDSEGELNVARWVFTGRYRGGIRGASRAGGD